jgi:hypothetical protein
MTPYRQLPRRIFTAPDSPNKALYASYAFHQIHSPKNSRFAICHLPFSFVHIFAPILLP